MAIINSYPLATPETTDLVLGTKKGSNGRNQTKSFSVASLQAITAGVTSITSSTPTTITIGGTSQIPTIGTITGTVQDNGTALATGDQIYDFVTGKITGTINTLPIWTTTTSFGDSLISQANNGVVINGNSTDGKLTLNCSAGTHGVTIQSPAHSAGATYTLILPTTTGSAGQVLTSGGGATDQLTWSTNGNVGGTGTQNKLAKWSNATTLADSNIEDTGTLVTISSATKVTGDLELDADLIDINGATGTAGQLLSSLGTGNGVDWVDAPVSGVTSLDTTDTNLLTITGTGAGPYTGAVVATPNTAAVSSASNNLATGAQIQTAINSALAGAVTFKGTFNANTGQITGGSNYIYNPGASSNTIAIAIGDMYIVSTGGNFYGNAATPLNVGDEVIAVSAAGIGASAESDWNAVPSAGGGVTDVTSGNTTAIGITPTTGSVVVTSNAYAGGANVGHVPSGGSAGKYLDGALGAWTTLPAGDTYTLQAGAKVSTSVPLQLDAATGTDSVVNLKEGTNITLTQNSATEIEIAAAGGSSLPTKTVDQTTIANATTGTINLSVSPSSENYTDMYVSGVYQNKTTYSLSGSTITLDGGAYFPNGAIVEVVSTT